MSDDTKKLSAEQVAELRRLRDAALDALAAEWLADVGLEGSASSVADFAYVTALRGAAPALLAAAEERDRLREENERLRNTIARIDADWSEVIEASRRDEVARLRERVSGLEGIVDAAEPTNNTMLLLQRERLLNQRDALRAEVERLRAALFTKDELQALEQALRWPGAGVGDNLLGAYHSAVAKIERAARAAPPNQEQPKPGAEACPECGGSGRLVGHFVGPCPTCNGTGQRGGEGGSK